MTTSSPFIKAQDSVLVMVLYKLTSTLVPDAPAICPTQAESLAALSTGMSAGEFQFFFAADKGA